MHSSEFLNRIPFFLLINEAVQKMSHPLEASKIQRFKDLCLIAKASFPSDDDR